jgi:hypothetical protein
MILNNNGLVSNHCTPIFCDFEKITKQGFEGGYLTIPHAVCGGKGGDDGVKCLESSAGICDEKNRKIQKEMHCERSEVGHRTLALNAVVNNGCMYCVIIHCDRSQSSFLQCSSSQKGNNTTVTAVERFVLRSSMDSTKASSRISHKRPLSDISNMRPLTSTPTKKKPKNLDNSFDVLPSTSPLYKYYKRDAIQKQAERRKLPGRECEWCHAFWKKQREIHGNEEAQRMLKRVSRHRNKYERPVTPPGFWNPVFTPSPTPSPQKWDLPDREE